MNCYLPMECTIVGKDEYTFEHVYKPVERAMDVALQCLSGSHHSHRRQLAYVKIPIVGG